MLRYIRARWQDVKRYTYSSAMSALSRELCRQCFCLPEVWRLKPLREPAVDLHQQMAGCVALALLLPQPTQAGRRPQLQPFRLLAAGDSHSLAKADLCLLPLVPCVCLRQQEFALEPIQLGLIEPHPALVHCSQGLAQERKARFELPTVPILLGQQGEIICVCAIC